MIKARVSIITPSYNSAGFIVKTIESVLSQTYSNWEMLIIDDCSTDNSVKLIEDIIQKDSRIKLIKLERNSGPAIARNVGICNAMGRYISFLDSDDLWLPEKIEKQLCFMKKFKIELSYTAYKKMDENGVVRNYVINVPDQVGYKALLSHNVIACLTAMYDTSLIGKIYTDNVRHEDYVLWLKILKKGYIAYGLNEPLAVYRVRASSVSGNKIKAAKWVWNVYRRVEKLSLTKSLFYFISYAYYGYKKYRN